MKTVAFLFRVVIGGDLSKTDWACSRVNLQKRRNANLWATASSGVLYPPWPSDKTQLVSVVAPLKTSRRKGLLSAQPGTLPEQRPCDFCSMPSCVSQWSVNRRCKGT